jgi:cytochrome c-type biogenesis protein CcmF
MVSLLSELVQGTKVTVGPLFFNRVIIPVALLLLTAIGPLLAWRKTSVESLRRNFLWPALGAVAIGVVMMLFGVRPWEDSTYFYATMAAVLSALVIFTVVSEFIRGGRVISRHTSQGMLWSMMHLGHRNTRRYGGYVVHFGIALVAIGIVGSAFNQQNEQELAFGDKMTIGPYTLVCQSYTQEDNPNYASEWAIINVFRNGKQVTTMYPERRVYKASQQPQTMPRIYPTFKQDFFLLKDLYLIYAGLNPDNGHPIIKAHLNPLVPWIWTGLIVMILGTALALIPNAAPVQVRVPARVPATVSAGD